MEVEVNNAAFTESDKISKKRRVSNAAAFNRTDVTDFELMKKIGKGGFGEVYLCRKRDTKEILALKIIDKSNVWAQNKLRSVKNERDVLAKSGHAQLVTMYYSFQDSRYLYLAMEYCPGGDFYHLLQNFSRLDVPESLLYMAEMILGVHTLHSLGYIHRDLKPDNFLIDARGHLKLADFGLSKEGIRSYSDLPSPCVSQSSLLETKKTYKMETGRSYSMVGSPDYMSPEVLCAPLGGYGEEVDWWSLGCLFYDMVCGVTPFCGNTPQEVFDNITNWKTVLPRVMAEGQDVFTPEFEDLLLSLLCEPEVRLGKDIDALKQHPVFSPVNWENVSEMEPAFIPRLSSVDDISYFQDPSMLTHSATTPRKSMKKSESSFDQYYNSKLYQKNNKIAPAPAPKQTPTYGPLFSPVNTRNNATNENAIHRFTQSEQKLRPQVSHFGNQITNTPHRGNVNATPVDKQILGFTFVRNQTTQPRTNANAPPVPVFNLDCDENNQFYMDDNDDIS